MTKTARVTEGDLFDAQLLHARPGGAKTLLFLFILLVFGYYLYREVGVAPGTLAGGFLGGLVGFVGYFALFLKFKCKKIYRQQRNLQLPYEFSWDSSGIEMKNEMGKGRIEWSDFVKFKESKKVILLYQSDALFNIVPKTAFENEQQLSEFSSHLQKVHG